MKLNHIYNGDCFEIIKTFETNSVDFSLTSPPYNLYRSIRPKSEGKKRIKQVYDGYSDNLSEEEYEEFLVSIINELIRVSRKQVFFNIQYLSNTKSTLFKLLGGFRNQIKDLLIWHKQPSNPAIKENVLTHNYEFVIVFDKNNISRSYEGLKFDRRGKDTTCFIEKTNSFVNKERFNCEGNFAIMSIQVARRLIQTFTKENEIVLDPFMGSGTTALACVESSRQYVGIEINKDTIDIANRRLEVKNNTDVLF
jgi:DNA modification methylase